MKNLFVKDTDEATLHDIILCKALLYHYAQTKNEEFVKRIPFFYDNQEASQLSKVAILTDDLVLINYDYFAEQPQHRLERLKEIFNPDNHDVIKLNAKELLEFSKKHDFTRLSQFLEQDTKNLQYLKKIKDFEPVTQKLLEDYKIILGERNLTNDYNSYIEKARNLSKDYASKFNQLIENIHDGFYQVIAFSSFTKLEEMEVKTDFRECLAKEINEQPIINSLFREFLIETLSGVLTKAPETRTTTKKEADEIKQNEKNKKFYKNLK